MSIFVPENDESKIRKIKVFMGKIDIKLNKSEDKATAVDRFEASIQKLGETSVNFDKWQKKLVESFLDVDLTTLKVKDKLEFTRKLENTSLVEFEYTSEA